MTNKPKWERLTGSRKVSSNPVNIYSIIVTAHSGKQAKCTLYDGESTGDPQMTTLQTLSGEAKVINFNPPVTTLRGLYIDFTGDVDEVMIHYDLEKE